jgi:hypothetical protein
MSETTFDVGRLQRGLQLIKEQDDHGIWKPIPGVTYEKSLTCVYDEYTDIRAHAAARYIEEQRQQHATLACWTYDLCDPVHITSIAVSADRRTIFVKPGDVWDAVKANMEAQIRDHGMTACPRGGGGAAPSPSPGSPTPPPPPVGDATRIFVSALQLVAIKLGRLSAANYDCTWGPKTRAAARALLADFTVQAPFDFVMDEQVFQGGQVVDLKPKATWDILGDHVAREITTIDYKPCPATGGGGGSPAPPEEDEELPQPVEAGMGGGGWLLLGGVVGVGYWLWKRSR